MGKLTHRIGKTMFLSRKWSQTVKTPIKRIAIALMALFLTLQPLNFAVAYPVFDAANFGQNLLTAARTLQQINNQIRQLQNESQMLLNQAQNLQNLPVSVATDLQASLAQVDGLIRSANGIAYQISTINAEYQRLFPEQYATAVATSRILQDAQEAWRQSREGYRHSLHVQASVVDQVRTDGVVLDTLVASSQGAVGNLQVAQAGNQLTALAAKQTMQLQTLTAATARAEALEQARTIAMHEQARARFQNFLGDRSPYTPN